MADIWAGLTAGLVAGAAGATAMNAVAYLDQAGRGDPATSSPTGDTAATAAAQVTGSHDLARTSALGPLGGLAIGVSVGGLAGVLRGTNATPPRPIAAVLTGLVAMGIGDGVAVATGAAPRDWSKPAQLVRDLAAHLAYGAVTGFALHRMLDPHTPHVHR